MAQLKNSSGRMSQAQHAQLERWLLEFDEHWTDRLLGKYLRNLPFEGRSSQRVALAELVKIDLERQWSSGARIRLEAYLKETDLLGDVNTVDAELILAEYQARLNAGETPDLARFATRFPRQMDEVQRLIADCTFTAAPSKPTQEERPTHSQAGETIGFLPKASPQHKIPKQLGKYDIRRFLARGGMGAVYKAYDRTLERHVAIKVPHAEIVNNPAALDRFYREAKAVARLDHPNICSVYEVDEVDGIHFLAMAYIRGEDLRRYIDRNHPLDPQQIASAMYKLARAMQTAHEKGILHRDLKPSNIRVARGGELKIMDFGLAKRLDEQKPSDTQTGQMLGTPVYMSPEQAEGNTDAIGPAADIYGVGAVMYQMLTGEPPFSGSVARILVQVVEGNLRPPSEVNGNIDPRLEPICLTAMALRIEDRFASMADFATALQQYVLQKATLAPPEPSLLTADGSPVEAPSFNREQGIIVDHFPSAPKTGRHKLSRIRALMVFTISALVLVLFGITIYAKTDVGTVRLELIGVRDDDIVRIEAEELDQRELRHPIPLESGMYSLKVIREGQVVHRETIEVVRREEKVVRVDLSNIRDSTTDEGEGAARNDQVAKIELKESSTENAKVLPYQASIFASCDDRFEMYLNGSFLLQHRGTSVGICKARMREGDVLTVKAVDNGGGNGFACAILFDNLPGKEIVTSRDSPWRGYRPSDATEWFDPEGITDEILCDGGNTWAAGLVRGRTGLKDVKLIWGWRDGWSFKRGGATYLVLRVPKFNSDLDVARAPLNAVEQQNPWQSIFNGNDLSGWTAMLSEKDRQQETTSGWSVHDGELICDTDAPGWLRYDEVQTDFEFDLEFWLRPMGNSGILVRTSGIGDLMGKETIEVQLIDGHSDLWQTGAIHGIIGRRTDHYIPGEWNQLRIRCVGERIIVSLNENQIVDTTTSKHDQIRNAPRYGYIGLYNWLGKANGTRFRNIRLRRIEKDIAPLPGDLSNPKLRGDDADYSHLLSGEWKSVMDDFYTQVDGDRVKRIENDVRLNGMNTPVELRGPVAKDVIIRARVQHNSGRQPQLNLRGGDNWSYATWWSSHAGSIGVGKKVNGKWQDLAIKRRQIPVGESYEWVFAVIEHDLSVYVDGRKVLEYKDDVERSAGTVGIGVLDAVSTFSDVEVMILDE